MFNGRRQPSCDGTSRMTRECQVRICERLGVKFPGPTRHFRRIDLLRCSRPVRCPPIAAKYGQRRNHVECHDHAAACYIGDSQQFRE
jgi:hypothetical protein